MGKLMTLGLPQSSQGQDHRGRDKANSHPETRAGEINGNVMAVNTFKGRAPNQVQLLPVRDPSLQAASHEYGHIGHTKGCMGDCDS